MKIFAVNPGSTSTKVAVIEVKQNDGEKRKLNVIFAENIAHSFSELERFKNLTDQIPYRMEKILECIEKGSIDLKKMDAFVGRAGGLYALEGGTYTITDLMTEHARTGANGVLHPANLGCIIAQEFSKKYKKPGYTVNPPDVDELQDTARITGIKGVYRCIHLHALNLKETAIRHADEHGQRYEDENYIVCHIGGGISVSAHKRGKMVDGFDISGGEGAMAPTRCGNLSVLDTLSYLEHHSVDELREKCQKTGGFVSHFNTSDALSVYNRGRSGDKYAGLVWDAMVYQIEKCIGAMASVLKGNVRAILLGGGTVHNKEFVSDIIESCGYIAPVYAYPGEFEMEALAAGAFRVLSGEEAAKEYSGRPAICLEI